MKPLTGNAHTFGDHVDTDRIIAGKYTKTLDMEELAAHVMEDLDPDFVRSVLPGDFVVAGRNFGCGSSREQAPLALKTAGIKAVIAASFSRLFYRNAINIGLPVLEIGNHAIQAGNRIQVLLEKGEVRDLSAGRVYAAAPLSALERAIFEAGGLVAFLARGGYGQIKDR